MKFITHTSVIIENNLPSTPIDEIEEVGRAMDAGLNQELKIPADVMDSFKIKDTLNPELWDNYDSHIHPKVRTHLLKIAKDFLKGMKVPKDTVIKDIIFTGSLANYNWSKFSDVDLHIVLDFDQFEGDPEMIDDYFYAQKTLWNDEHEIKMFEYPVEVYAQNSREKLNATSVFSLTKNKWVKKPSREKFTSDIDAVKKKAQKFLNGLKSIRDDFKDGKFQTVINATEKLKDKVYQMRKAGLEKGGELSQENLVFKTLRRTSFMDLLNSFKAKAYDTQMSIQEGTKYLPYDDRPEMKNSSYKSLSGSQPDMNTIRFKMAKASKTAKTYKDETGDESYFMNPTIGDGFYQVEIRHDGQIRTKHVRPSGDMSQMGGSFHPSDLGTCKSYQNIARYCFVKAGKNGTSIGASPAEDAANKVLVIFGQEIKSFLGDDSYVDDTNQEYSTNKMSDKMQTRKQKKDLEMKLKRKISDREFDKYLQTGEEPKAKEGITMSPEDKNKFYKDQEEKQKRIDMLRMKMQDRMRKGG